MTTPILQSDRVWPSHNPTPQENQGYGRLTLAAAYHQVIHDLSMTRSTPQEVAAIDLVIQILIKKRDTLHQLGHSEINRARIGK